MNEALIKINSLLKKFNTTFEVSANIIEDGDGGAVADGLKIDGIKNDGTEFLGEMFDMFSIIISNVSEEHELVYDPKKGLVIAKQHVTVNYIIED